MIKYLLPLALFAAPSIAFAQDDSQKEVSTEQENKYEGMEVILYDVHYENQEVEVKSEKMDMIVIREYEIEYNGVIYVNRIVEFRYPEEVTDSASE